MRRRSRTVATRNEAAQIAAVAVAEAARATDTVRQLGDSSAEIGNVIKLITAIAEQTNLLARCLPAVSTRTRTAPPAYRP